MAKYFRIIEPSGHTDLGSILREVFLFFLNSKEEFLMTTKKFLSSASATFSQIKNILEAGLMNFAQRKITAFK